MQRREYSSTPVWPYIAVVTLLFMLSAWAPRYWRSTQPPRIQAPAWVGYRETFVAAETPASFLGPDMVVREAETARVVAPREEVKEGSEVPTLMALNQFQAPRQDAVFAPPVAERVALDVSVAEMPNLPDPDQPTTMPSRLHALPLVPVVGPEVAPLPRVTKKPMQWLPEVASCWPYPAALMETLDELAQHATSRAWAEQVRRGFEQVHRCSVFCSPDVRDQLIALGELSRGAGTLAAAAESDQLRAKILRASYAVQRRVETWLQIHGIVSNGRDLHAVAMVSTGTLVSHLDGVDQRLDRSVHGDAWRRYLKLDELRIASRSGDAEQRRQIARCVLNSLEASHLNRQQLAILQEPPFDGLSMTLRRWASDSIDYRRLLGDLELYEQTRSTIMARQLATEIQAVRWSIFSEVVQLADTLDSHYRNANLRVTLSEALMNRLLPEEYAFEEEVSDYLFGARVYGESRAVARLRVDLVPDRRKWCLRLLVAGAVESDTATTKGPATFYNTGLSRYLACKSLLVDQQGVRTESTETESNSQIELHRYETDFDFVPVFGWIARSIALQQHNDKYEQARQETDTKLEALASERMDREVQRQVDDVRKTFQQKWLFPLRRLHLEPFALDMETTEQNLIVRYRLAGTSQLAAYTPRPRAPKGSLLSAQIHESALNNTLEQLNLNGRREGLRALYRELAEIFQRPELEVPEDLPDNVTIQFADRDAVRLRCDQGRVTVTLRIAELKRKRRKPWRHFAVRAYYIPDSTQLDANLVREGYIELAGLRLNTFDQIALRGIFSKVLSDDRPFNIINKRLSQNPVLADLHVTQFVVNDGWIGVALGPQRGGRVVRRITDIEGFPVVR
ncbi:MAG: hypothetical protein ACC628_09215 [Pirellulaceae bacterium]